MNKLMSLGSIVCWLSGCLEGRARIVRCATTFSRQSGTSCSGIPRLSHLGSLLFDLFIDDIGYDITHLYAADVNIFLKIEYLQGMCYFYGST